MSFILGLNPEQSKAVLATEGPILILAGAGSGKTRVITHRIAHLIKENGIRSESILAVTFTNKAAQEMKERCSKLLGEGRFFSELRTFHSLGLLLLRREHKNTGFSSDFTVYDTEMQESLIKEILKREDAENKEFKAKSLVGIFSNAKDSFQTAEEFAIENDGNSRERFLSKIFLEYEKEKSKRNAVDFGDLLLKSVKLLLERNDILEKYQNIWKYILVDEYQDTNKIQYLLIKLLAAKHRNLCVVGDDDQSIYSWRGADITNILNFSKDYPESLVIKLEENYRSTQNIIKAASSLISNNSNRSDKTIYTNNPIGEPIRILSYQNEMEEAEGIVQKILTKKKIRFSDFAIFYRTNSQSRYIEEVLRRKNIPYKIFGGFRFYDRKEVKDLIAYLSVIINPLDSTSLLRILNVPHRGIGDSTQEKLLQISINEGISLFETMVKDQTNFKKGTRLKLRELHSIFQDLMDALDSGESPSEIAFQIIERSGYKESLESEGTEDALSRLENLNEFVNAIKEYEESTDDPSLANYLNSITLLTSEEENKDLSDYVVLMTVHNAKGLEFKNVFLTGMEEGTFPHYFSIQDPSQLEEERRLCYVAITRARQTLEVSHSHVTRKFGEMEPRIPSRFLNEIPEECLEEKEFFGVRQPRESPRATKASVSKDVGFSSKHSKGELVFKEGMKVRHKLYGDGKITKLSGMGDNLKADVRFGQFVEKKFLLAYTPLEILP